MGRNGQTVTVDTQVSHKPSSQGGGVVTAKWVPKVSNPTPQSGETAGQVPSTQSTLGKQTEGPARPARGLRSQAPGCLEQRTKGVVLGLVGVPSREDGVQTHNHECTHVTVSHSPTPEPPPLWTEVTLWGCPCLWKAIGEGPSPSTKGGQHKCQGGEQEGLESAKTGKVSSQRLLASNVN